MNELRIPMKPQLWLWVANLLIQPPMTALFAWLAMDASSGLGARLLMLALAGCCGLLSVFTLLVLSRTLGRTFEITLDERTLRVPAVIRGVVEEVPLASITKAAITETRTTTTSFFQLDLEARDRKAVRVMSQFVGTDAFHQLVEALRARGVPFA